MKAKKSTKMTVKIDVGSGSRPFKNYLSIYNEIHNNFVVKNETISSRKHQH